MSRVLLGAAAAAGMLTGIIYWEAGDFVQPAMGELIAQVPAQVADQVAATLDPSDSVQAWVVTALERPLLREGRRPYPVVGNKSEAEGTVRLSGVLTGPFGGRAIFVSEASPKPIVVQEGARISSFVVRLINPGRVVVEANGSMRTLVPSFFDRPMSIGADTHAASRVGTK